MSNATCVNRLVVRFSRSKFHSVSPAGPKKTRRILLSTPVTSWPCWSKCSTASEPIKPLLPVTSTLTLRISRKENSSTRDVFLTAPRAIRYASEINFPPLRLPLENLRNFPLLLPEQAQKLFGAFPRKCDQICIISFVFAGNRKQRAPGSNDEPLVVHANQELQDFARGIAPGTCSGVLHFHEHRGARLAIQKLQRAAQDGKLRAFHVQFQEIDFRDFQFRKDVVQPANRYPHRSYRLRCGRSMQAVVPIIESINHTKICFPRIFSCCARH